MTATDDGRRSDEPRIEADGRWELGAQRPYDPEQDHELTTTVILAVADARGVEPTSITSPLLYDCVDAAALEEAIFGPGESVRRSVGSVEFRFDDLLVRVRSDGWVEVYAQATTDPG